MSQQVLTISQINEYIQTVVDADPMLGNVAVRGEISNYKMYPSGHHYFTLKDDGAALKCVMFRSSALKLKFRPENGMKVIAMGKISVYPRDGAYQLYCTAMAMDGVGDLHAAFEQMKAKLAAQGLFDEAHKKPIPKYPGIIGIVTSSAGAAIHDILRILAKRYPLTRVRLFPVRVQGAEAPGEIAGAIRYANIHNLADVLIVGRGGGSMEDLWAFNEEIVARAIYDSQIPVISAVGHEPDVSISDYVADLRAATPSNAAELAVPDCDALRQNMDSALSSMGAATARQIKMSKQRLEAFQLHPCLQSPMQYTTQRRNALQVVATKLLALENRYVDVKKHSFVSLTSKLDAMSPLKVLTRGYAMTENTDGQVISSVSQVQVGDDVVVSVYDGSFTAQISQVKENNHESGKSHL